MFVSYSQNHEDVLLWRALQDVEQGFYVDVGAADPIIDSVTNAFYERGWNGINIEPLPARAQRLRALRPRDKTLQVLVATESGLRDFFEVGDEIGLSTESPELALSYAEQGWSVNASTAPTVSLVQVLEVFNPSDIHFLKIDVEGAEYQVLSSADFSRFRPWIVVVESVEPFDGMKHGIERPRGDWGVGRSTHEGWEPILLAANYRLAHFDGLNRFYVADERWQQLGPRLATPVNFLDFYVAASEAELRAEHDEAMAEWQNDRESLNNAIRSEETCRKLLEEEHHQNALIQIDYRESLGELAQLKEKLLHIEAELGAETQRSLRLLSELRNLENDVLVYQSALSSAESTIRQLSQTEAAASESEPTLTTEDDWRKLFELEIREMRKQVRMARANCEAAQAALSAIQKSRSWRVTRPLRGLRKLFRGRG